MCRLTHSTATARLSPKSRRTFRRCPWYWQSTCLPASNILFVRNKSLDGVAFMLFLKLMVFNTLIRILTHRRAFRFSNGLSNSLRQLRSAALRNLPQSSRRYLSRDQTQTSCIALLHQVGFDEKAGLPLPLPPCHQHVLFRAC